MEAKEGEDTIEVYMVGFVRERGVYVPMCQRYVYRMLPCLDAKDPCSSTSSSQVNTNRHPISEFWHGLSMVVYLCSSHKTNHRSGD